MVKELVLTCWIPAVEVLVIRNQPETYHVCLWGLVGNKWFMHFSKVCHHLKIYSRFFSKNNANDHLTVLLSL